MSCIAKPDKKKRTTSKKGSTPQKNKHTKPSVPKEFIEAKKVAQQMYDSLMAEGAPRATPMGYIIGGSLVMKMLLDQAVKQGGNREALRAQAMAYIINM